MIVAFALHLANEATANVIYDSNNNPSRIVGTISGKAFSVAPTFDNNVPRLSSEIKLKGLKVLVKNGQLTGAGTVNPFEVSRQVFPKTPEQYDNGLSLLSKGGICLGETALWLFAWDALETMGEPSGDTFAVEIGLDKKGKLAALRSTRISGVGRHCNQPMYLKNGSQLVLSGSGLSIFDLKAWKETASFPEENSTVISKRAFRSTNGMLFEYDFAKKAFVFMASHTLGYLMTGFDIGDREPILVFTRGLFTPDTRASYQFPGPDNDSPPDTYFIVDKKAIGFLSYGFPLSTPGILLTPRYLTPLSMIKR